MESSRAQDPFKKRFLAVTGCWKVKSLKNKNAETSAIATRKNKNVKYQRLSDAFD